MLRTNSKQAIKNIHNYIIKHSDFSSYDIEYFEKWTFKELSKNLLRVFRNEYINGYNKRYSEQDNFISWCQGLPSVLDTCYYYNRSAVQELGDILEETEEERNRFTEQQAEEMLTKLIYRELRKNEV